ncbi:TonB-dependent receptor plug domain-containing protein [Massilia niabensis]|uniref:TonB-dependent receptor plug domain-containing protein n=1 Tax=Massilia niabensis TaxID=544910 RepID=A0ABW0L3U8_9BURK
MYNCHPSRPRLRPLALLLGCALAAGAVTAASAAAVDQPEGADFADLSIEELANIQVTSVSKKPERLLEAPASVFVITADDIRRSGASTLPEALRLAPNLQVAQGNGASYAITARGLNGGGNSAPNKLLVLIDGRSVYTPLFSGVFWDVQDVMLEDIERIEVVSGPGGTLWGVNAVNGVINITTRSAHDTQGSLAMLRGANDGADVAFRQGGRKGEASWRVYGKAQGRSHTERASGAPVNDAWHSGQMGFRTDWERGADRFTLNGNANRGAFEQPAPGTIRVGGTNPRLGTVDTRGLNLTAGWQHALQDGGSVNLQLYYDYTRREVPPTFTESLDIVDLQFQHTLAPFGAHSLAWGANARYSWDRVQGSEYVAFLPERLNQTWLSLFAQDEITLTPTLRATLGARIESNPYTGAEFLPSARLSWSAAPGHAFWAAASRAVRAPSRIDADTFIPGRPPYILAGGPGVRSEVAKVFELGYRGQPLPRLSYSATLFYNDYDHLRTQELLPSRTAVRFANLMDGHALGIEMWGSFQATKAWRLSGGLTAMRERAYLKPESNDVSGPLNAGFDPSHSLQLRSTYSVDASRDVEIALRKVGALDLGPVPGYTALDARFGWRVRPGLELSVAAMNLNGSHPEYGGITTRAEVPRTVAVKLVWQN